MRDSLPKFYSNPKSFVNFLLPDREFGEGWGGVKNLRLLQGLLYQTHFQTQLSPSQFLVVEIILNLYGSEKQVRLERLRRRVFPYPITTESRRRKRNKISGLTPAHHNLSVVSSN
ncbi:hypothetical protein [Microcoleus sp. OTE_8_concoct_300]|uniref:hypothetical protein n=1 Tax=Microcoleus sp. OTE_8_concoct_300 TaxID=2964710 RepID=UPI00403FB008